jgi:hypothetical protein
MSFPNFLRGLAVLVLTVPAIFVARQTIPQSYDVSKSVTLTGFVTKVDWKDPQVFLNINVKLREERVSNWILEGSTAELVRTGWPKDKLSVGTEIKVTVNPAVNFDVALRAYITKIERPETRLLVAQ